MSEVTTLTDDAGRYVPGLKSGTLTMHGPFDAGAALHGEISGSLATDNAFIVTICPLGTAIGTFAVSIIGDVSEYAQDASVSDAVGYAVTAVPDEGPDMGFVAHALGAETVDGNGTAVDRGAGTTNGATATIHATAYSGLTSAAIKVQHSTDNSSWSDLVSFTSLTAVGSERKVVAAGTTVNRYVRVVTDVTGTGSITFLVAFAPR